MLDYFILYNINYTYLYQYSKETDAGNGSKQLAEETYFRNLRVTVTYNNYILIL